MNIFVLSIVRMIFFSNATRLVKFKYIYIICILTAKLKPYTLLISGKRIPRGELLKKDEVWLNLLD